MIHDGASFPQDIFRRGILTRRKDGASEVKAKNSLLKKVTMPHSHGLPQRQNEKMKLHSTPTQQYQTITGYEQDSVEINAIPYRHSLIVLPEAKPVVWPVSSFDALSADDFAQIDATKPDVVILGTGNKQRFIHPRLIAALTAQRIGVECMDNQAACRTYNILMAEGRKVALALVMENT